MRFAPVAFAVLFAGSAHAEPLPLRGPILPLTKLGLFQIYVMPPGGIADAASLSATQTFTGVNTFSLDAASTNTVLYPAICQRTSSGTPAIAMGCGMNFILENASNVNTIAGSVEMVWNDPVNATEDSQFQVKTMAAGAAPGTSLTIFGGAGLGGVATFAGSVTANAHMTLGATGNLSFNGRGFFTSPVAPVLIASGWMQQAAGSARVAADVTNATTTFAAVTGLSTNVISARKYSGRVVLRVDNSLAADGIKLDFNGGSATMTSFWAACHIDVGGTAVAVNQISTALATVINWSTITNDTYIACDLSFVPSSSSTFIMRQAGNAAVSGTLTTRLGSYWELNDVP